MEILDHGIFETKSGKYALFQHFHTLEDIKSFQKLMHENKVSVRCHQKRAGIGEVILGHSNDPEFWAELLPIDFVAARSIMKDAAKKALQHADLSGHYLNDLNTDELQEILLKPDEWNAEAVVVAEKLLENRGAPIGKETIENAVKARKIVLRTPKPLSFTILWAHYLNAVLSGLLIWPLGLIVAISSGIYFWKFKGTDSDGNRYLLYDEKAREDGRDILLVTGACVLLHLFYIYGT